MNKVETPGKKANWWKRCCLFLLVIFLLIVVGALSVANAAGLIKTPGLYQAFYRDPEPRRVVRYDPAKPFTLEEALSGLEDGKIPASRLHINSKGEQAIRITEEEFTRALYEIETGEGDEKKKLKETVRTIQITFEPNSAEIVVALTVRPTTVLVDFNPIFLSGGGIELDLNRVQVGSIKADFLIGMVEGVIKDSLKDLQTREIKRVELVHGEMHVYPDFEAIRSPLSKSSPTPASFLL